MSLLIPYYYQLTRTPCISHRYLPMLITDTDEGLFDLNSSWITPRYIFSWFLRCDCCTSDVREIICLLVSPTRTSFPFNGSTQWLGVTWFLADLLQISVSLMRFVSSFSCSLSFTFIALYYAADRRVLLCRVTSRGCVQVSVSVNCFSVYSMTCSSTGFSS